MPLPGVRFAERYPANGPGPKNLREWAQIFSRFQTHIFMKGKPTQKITHPNKNTVCASAFGTVCRNCAPFSSKTSRKQPERVCANCLCKLGGFLGGLPSVEYLCGKEGVFFFSSRIFDRTKQIPHWLSNFLGCPQPLDVHAVVPSTCNHSNRTTEPTRWQRKPLYCQRRCFWFDAIPANFNLCLQADHAKLDKTTLVAQIITRRTPWELLCVLLRGFSGPPKKQTHEKRNLWRDAYNNLKYL